MFLEENDFRTLLFQKFEVIQSLMIKLLSPIVQCAGLSHQSAILLFMINCEKECSITQLQKKFGWNQGNLSSYCKKLEKDGYLIKKRKKEDERVVILSLSESGKAIVAQLKAASEELTQHLEIVNQQDKDKVLQGLDMLSEMLQGLEKENSKC